jgi:hypothetical protein
MLGDRTVPIPDQAAIETPSGRKAATDHGPATADDDRD